MVFSNIIFNSQEERQNESCNTEAECIIQRKVLIHIIPINYCWNKSIVPNWRAKRIEMPHGWGRWGVLGVCGGEEVGCGGQSVSRQH